MAEGEHDTPRNSFAGHPLRGQAREIVYNVSEYLKKMRVDHELKYNLAEETALACGVGSTTVKKILAEGKRSIASRGELKFSTPKGRKNARMMRRIEIDDFTKAAIRRKVHEMYTVTKIFPTLAKIRAELQAADILTCGRTKLREVLISMGFKWRKCQNQRKILIERSYIVNQRIEYLRNIKTFREENKNIVYVDETYVNAHHVTGKCWHSPEEIGLTKPAGKGNRLIIVHGGGESGFVKDALLIFTAHQKSGDYHESMNYENFSKWISQKLIPNLPDNSVIVLDNAKYHNVEVDKKPNSSSLKAQIQDWLARHSVQFDAKMTKAELLMLVKTQPSQPKYKVDTLLVNSGHMVVRLPPYHPDLNPIEMVWGAIKDKVAKSINAKSLPQKAELCKELFSNYTRDEWQKCCDHVKKIEKVYWESDHIMDDTVDRLIISVNTSSDSEISGTDEDSVYSDSE